MVCCRGTTWPSVLRAFFLLYWVAHVGGWQRRFWRGWLIKVILQIQTDSIPSLWPTPHSAEPASCPVYVKLGLVSSFVPLYCDFIESWSTLSVLAVLAHGVAVRGVKLGLMLPRPCKPPSKHILCTQL